MLTHAPTTTLIPVFNVERARRFYEEKLGLIPQGPQPDGSFLFKCGGGATLALIPKPEGTPLGGESILSFEVENIEAEVRDLEARGVEFSDLDLPWLKTIHHVWDLGTEKTAWFNDPEGNVLCLHEDVFVMPS